MTMSVIDNRFQVSLHYIGGEGITFVDAFRTWREAYVYALKEFAANPNCEVRLFDVMAHKGHVNLWVIVDDKGELTVGHIKEAKNE